MVLYGGRRSAAPCRRCQRAQPIPGRRPTTAAHHSAASTDYLRFLDRIGESESVLRPPALAVIAEDGADCKASRPSPAGFCSYGHLSVREPACFPLDSRHAQDMRRDS